MSKLSLGTGVIAKNRLPQDLPPEYLWKYWEVASNYIWSWITTSRQRLYNQEEQYGDH
ncbi:MAG: hypothetical protein ACFCBU_17215 [Cyanophyceae cyanobacterium]